MATFASITTLFMVWGVSVYKAIISIVCTVVHTVCASVCPVVHSVLRPRKLCCIFGVLSDTLYDLQSGWICESLLRQTISDSEVSWLRRV